MVGAIVKAKLAAGFFGGYDGIGFARHVRPFDDWRQPSIAVDNLLFKPVKRIQS